MLPAQNALHIIPIVAQITKRKESKLIYSVIGGWLPSMLQDKKYLGKPLQKLDSIWVETSTMKCALEKQGFKIVGIFDVNPVMQGVSVRGIEIRMIDELPEFVKDNHVEIATLTLPKAKALDMAKLLVDVGVKAIWNFAHTDLNLFMPEDVIVENVHLSESLMRLSYNLSRFEKDHKQEQGKI